MDPAFTWDVGKTNVQGGGDGTSKIPSCDWSMWFSLVILLSSHWSNIFTFLRPRWRQVLQYKCTEAGFLLTCTTGPSKVCATIFNENTVGRSILFGSKNVRKGGALIF